MLSSLHVMIVLWSAVVSRLSARPKITTNVRYCSPEVGFVVLSPEVVGSVEPGVERSFGVSGTLVGFEVIVLGESWVATGTRVLVSLPSVLVGVFPGVWIVAWVLSIVRSVTPPTPPSSTR